MAKKTIDFRVVSALEDRHGTIIEAAGMDLRHYRRNPVVLFNHDYARVIGRAPGIALQGSEIVAGVEFDDTDSFALDILRKVENGFMSGASAGFIVHQQDGKRITRSELVEFSVVSVPSNPEALALRHAGRQMRYARAVRSMATRGGRRPATNADYIHLALTLQPMITREVLRALGRRR